MKFILQFDNPEFFVGRNDAGNFEKQDDPSKAKTWDTPAAAMASSAHQFFKFDSLHVIPAYDDGNPAEYDALLREGEESAHLDCGCLLYRPDPDFEKEVAILFCPVHTAADKGRKALEVLGRLHDGLSDMLESGRLTEGAIPDDYQWLVSLLVNESLPLFAPGERMKPADVSGAAVGAPDVVGEELADLKTTRVPAARVEVSYPLDLSGWVVPADPEDQNEDRADWGGNAIESIMNDTRTDKCDALGDLLADLAHWADRSCSETGQTFAMAVQNAYMHYSEETGGEGLQFEGIHFQSEEFVTAPAEAE